MSAESWSNSRVCAGLHSAPVRRSFDKEIGATRVVVVIDLSLCCRMGSSPLCSGGFVRIRSAGLLWSFCQNDFEKLEKFADLRTRDDEGRQEAESKVVRAVDQQAALHSFGNEGCAFDGKIDADHEA